jgi:hypothetical protein
MGVTLITRGEDSINVQNIDKIVIDKKTNMFISSNDGQPIYTIDIVIRDSDKHITTITLMSKKEDSLKIVESKEPIYEVRK